MRRLARGASVAAMAVLLASCFAESDPGQLSIYGPYVGPEADIFGEVLDRFEDETGITTNYVGSGSFQTDFDVRVNSNDLSDVTVLPQVALLDSLVEDGHVTPLPEEASEELIERVGQFWSAIAAPDGRAIAVPYRFVVKSIVWYRPDVFAEQGYEVPETLSGLKAVMRQMIGDGFTPWCAGMDAAGATGWWATDWVEDIVARRVGFDYWLWATLQTPFTDGAIVDAMAEFQEIIDVEGAVNGGTRAILNVRVEDAIDPMFAEQPGCLMHKQASFQPIWLPADVEFGDGRLDVFPLPGVEPGDPPMLISGEIAVATSDNPAATEFLEFLLTEDGFQPWLDAGGSLVATADVSEVPVGNELDVRLTEMVANAPLVVLDASDLMPQPVGTGTFFTGMIDLVAGRSPSVVAGEIQESVEALPPVEP